MNTYAEDACDIWIAEHLPVPATGVYVDVGASFPTIGNNCHWLRERGWNGLNIDGNPGYAEFWTGHTFIPAVISTEPEVRFRTSCNPMLCRITHEGQPTSTRTLISILEEHGIAHVDYLSLDCEGSEMDALLTLDLERWPVKIIIAEFKTAAIEGPEVEVDDRVRDYLVPLGWEMRHETFANRIYYKP